MKKFRCLIVDDESIAQRIIANYLANFKEYEIVARCMTAIEALSLLEQEQIDLMFLDIEMPKLDGLSLIRTMSNPPSVIITTAHREHALEGFELEVVDYLLKPISLERFLKALSKFKKQKQTLNPDHSSSSANKQTVYFKSDKKNFRIAQESIKYIEAMNNYILIHTTKKRFTVYRSLSDFLTELGDDFIRIHKSYVINKNQIQFYTKELVQIDEKSLPIGKTFKGVVGQF